MGPSLFFSTLPMPRALRSVGTIFERSTTRTKCFGSGSELCWGRGVSQSPKTALEGARLKLPITWYSLYLAGNTLRHTKQLIFYIDGEMDFGIVLQPIGDKSSIATTLSESIRHAGPWEH